MKFSIRDVLWLTVVVALAVCWGLDRAQFRRELVKARDAEQLAGMEAKRAMNESEYARYMAELGRASAATAPLPVPQAETPSPTAVP